MTFTIRYSDGTVYEIERKSKLLDKVKGSRKSFRKKIKKGVLYLAVASLTLSQILSNEKDDMLVIDISKSYSINNNLDVQNLETENLDIWQGEKNSKIKVPRHTLEGRILRTERWEDYINNAEKKYTNLPKGLIAATIMRESYGDPLIVNSNDDVGAGLGCFQPGMAEFYGLETYQDAKFTGRNTEYGKKLRKLVIDNNYNLDIYKKNS